jgi:hypothetical protein
MCCSKGLLEILEREKRRGAARFQGSLERLGAQKKKEEPIISYSM